MILYVLFFILSNQYSLIEWSLICKFNPYAHFGSWPSRRNATDIHVQSFRSCYEVYDVLYDSCTILDFAHFNITFSARPKTEIPILSWTGMTTKLLTGGLQPGSLPETMKTYVDWTLQNLFFAPLTSSMEPMALCVMRRVLSRVAVVEIIFIEWF